MQRADLASSCQVFDITDNLKQLNFKPTERYVAIVCSQSEARQIRSSMIKVLSRNGFPDAKTYISAYGLNDDTSILIIPKPCFLAYQPLINSQERRNLKTIQPETLDSNSDLAKSFKERMKVRAKIATSIKVGIDNFNNRNNAPQLVPQNETKENSLAIDAQKPMSLPQLMPPISQRESGLLETITPPTASWHLQSLDTNQPLNAGTLSSTYNLGMFPITQFFTSMQTTEIDSIRARTEKSILFPGMTTTTTQTTTLQTPMQEGTLTVRNETTVSTLPAAIQKNTRKGSAGHVFHQYFIQDLLVKHGLPTTSEPIILIRAQDPTDKRALCSLYESMSKVYAVKEKIGIRRFAEFAKVDYTAGIIVMPQSLYEIYAKNSRNESIAKGHVQQANEEISNLVTSIVAKSNINALLPQTLQTTLPLETKQATDISAVVDAPELNLSNQSIQESSSPCNAEVVKKTKKAKGVKQDKETRKLRSSSVYETFFVKGTLNQNESTFESLILIKASTKTDLTCLRNTISKNKAVKSAIGKRSLTEFIRIDNNAHIMILPQSLFEIYVATSSNASLKQSVKQPTPEINQLVTSLTVQDSKQNHVQEKNEPKANSTEQTTKSEINDAVTANAKTNHPIELGDTEALSQAERISKSSIEESKARIEDPIIVVNNTQTECKNEAIDETIDKLRSKRKYPADKNQTKEAKRKKLQSIPMQAVEQKIQPEYEKIARTRNYADGREYDIEYIPHDRLSEPNCQDGENTDSNSATINDYQRINNPLLDEVSSRTFAHQAANIDHSELFMPTVKRLLFFSKSTKSEADFDATYAKVSARAEQKKHEFLQQLQKDLPENHCVKEHNIKKPRKFNAVLNSFKVSSTANQQKMQQTNLLFLSAMTNYKSGNYQLAISDLVKVFRNSTQLIKEDSANVAIHQKNRLLAAHYLEYLVKLHFDKSRQQLNQINQATRENDSASAQIEPMSDMLWDDMAMINEKKTVRYKSLIGSEDGNPMKFTNSLFNFYAAGSRSDTTLTDPVDLMTAISAEILCEIFDDRTCEEYLTTLTGYLSR